MVTRNRCQGMLKSGEEGTKRTGGLESHTGGGGTLNAGSWFEEAVGHTFAVTPADAARRWWLRHPRLIDRRRPGTGMARGGR